MKNRNLIFDLSFDELRAFVLNIGEPEYRTSQIWKGLYKHFYDDANSFTNLPLQLRKKLATTVRFSSLTKISTKESRDNDTVKTLFKLPDQQYIEAVLMRYEKRRTLCISTQAGCGMGCSFCATGQMGFRRHLSSGEIVEQIIYYARNLQEKEERLTNIVFMGMGEPFHNYEATMKAIETLNHSEGFNFGQRRFTISTVGLIPQIQRFTKENTQVNLAVSLHSTNDTLRSSMLPINTKFPIADLILACREYTKFTKRRITFEWALIQKVNDTEEEAMALAKLLSGMLCHVNIIPLNPTKGFEGEATTQERAINFQKVLNKSGIPCTIRKRRGIDIEAGCGQLATEYESQQAES